MPQYWNISSIAPHDFYLCLDFDPYFDHEHNPESIFEEGFTRSLPLTDRDVLVTIRFNGDPEHPEFAIAANESISDEEQKEANKLLARILGTEIDLDPFYNQAGDDALLAPLFQEFYGLKRMARANFFEDAINRIIQTQISHKPTAKKMVYEVRQAFSPRLESKSGTVAAWPRPERLQSGDPVAMKKHGLSLRKGEYLVGLADEFVSGNLTNAMLEDASPESFYEIVNSVRGIGPTTAQDLMLFRNRTDAVFPSKIDKGMERGLRRWIILSYGGNPDDCSEDEFQNMIQNWKGFEALAIEHLFANYFINEKKRRKK